MTKKPKVITEFNYTLKAPVKVAKGGEEELVFILKLKCPTAKHRAHLIRLKQGFLKAAVSAQRSNAMQVESNAPQEDEGHSEITGDAIMALLYISDVDLVGLEDEFRSLLLAGVCEVLEGVNLNSHTAEQISLNDFEGLMGEYLANFIILSST